MSGSEVKTIMDKTEILFKKEISFFKAAIILVVVITAVAVVLFAAGQKYFWQAQPRTPQERGLNYYHALVDREPEKAEHRVNLGWHYYQAGDYEKALENYFIALGLEPNHGGALFNAGITYIRMLDYASAADYLVMACRENPTYREGHIALGVAFIGLKEWELAEQALGNALDINKHSADIYFYLGQIAAETGNDSEALEYFEEALRYNPHFSAAQTALQNLNSGQEVVKND